MSGLAVLFHRDGRPQDPSEIWSMLEAVSYRGPEGLRVHRSGNVSLGHALLAMTPEDETQLQPFVSRASGCAIVADVRLDNRSELLQQLPGSPATACGDAELILRAYEYWGTDAPTHLLGDFAFGIWDPRRNRLFCARDVRGQRSLFYRADHRTFAAASEIHQLFQDATVPIIANEARIRARFIPMNTFRNEKEQADTFYQGIFAVEPGSCLVVTPDEQRTWHYWELTPPAEIRYRTNQEYEEHFLALFKEAVRSRLRCSRPLGAMLSGGIDSSSAVCTVMQMYRSGDVADHGFTSFTQVFDGLECDERDLVAEMQRAYGFQARYFPYDPTAGWFDTNPKGFRWSPLVSERLSNVFGSAIDGGGVRMVLCGDSADSYTRGSRLVFDSLIRQGRLAELPRHLRAYRRETGESWRKIAGLHCVTPLLPLALQKQLVSRFEKRRLGRLQPNLMPHWFQPALRDELSRRHIEMVLGAERTRKFANPSRAFIAANLYPPELARTFVGWPVELWNPWSDLRLQEFFLAIPPEQMFSPHPTEDNDYSSSKQIVRRAMKGIVPERIRTRIHQTHFASQFLGEAQRRWPDLEKAFGPNGNADVLQLGYVNREQFWGRLEGLRAGQYDNDLMFVLTILGVESWLRTFKLPRAQQTQVHTPWRRPSHEQFAAPVGPHAELVSRSLVGQTRAGMPSRNSSLGEEVRTI